MHLKEYSVGELRALFQRAGFDRVEVVVKAKRWIFRFPAGPFVLLERAVEAFPPTLARTLLRRTPIRKMLGISHRIQRHRISHHSMGTVTL